MMYEIIDDSASRFKDWWVVVRLVITFLSLLSPLFGQADEVVNQ